MHLNAFHLFGIDVAADVISLVDHKHALPARHGTLRNRRAEQPGAHDQNIILHLLHSFRFFTAAYAAAPVFYTICTYVSTPSDNFSHLWKRFVGQACTPPMGERPRCTTPQRRSGKKGGKSGESPSSPPKSPNGTEPFPAADDRHDGLNGSSKMNGISFIKNVKFRKTGLTEGRGKGYNKIRKTPKERKNGTV